jgi:hypothetical protein
LPAPARPFPRLGLNVALVQDRPVLGGNNSSEVRDWNFRAMYGAWDALKNVDKVLPNHRLNWSAYILGKRESR